MNETLAKEIADRVFVESGLRICEIDTTESPLVRLYEGSGMVWGVAILPSFDVFEREWQTQERNEARVIDLLGKASTVDEKWNLAVLVIVLEVITERVLPLVSHFQEDPTAYARFVLAVDRESDSASLEDRIGFLLLRWLNAPSGRFQEDITIEADIQGLVRAVGREIGVPTLDSTVAALLTAHPDAEQLVASLQSDVEGNTSDETR